MFVFRPGPFDNAPHTYIATVKAPPSAEARARLQALAPALAGLPEWNAEAAETVVRRFADQEGLKLGPVAQPLRAAVTGRAVSPPIFDVLAILGRTESLARIADLGS
jgi:glutamyl-tRNA synthetase